MYEPSRVLLSFHIAGFQYADGALVLGDLKVGDKLTLCVPSAIIPMIPRRLQSTTATPSSAMFRETRSARCP